MDFNKMDRINNAIDDDVVLPADTLAILNEFLQNKTLDNSEKAQQGLFEEDWQLSQFWYSEQTKRISSKVCLKLILKHSDFTPTSEIKIALLSCPSIYKSVRAVHPNGIVHIFEFDNRFAAFGDDFVHYDYKDLEKRETLLEKYRNYFDIIIADPPFLSEECIEHTSTLIKQLKKDNSDILMCSGQTTALWIEKFLQLKQCEFRPEHERNLANEFCSYANFELDEMVVQLFCFKLVTIPLLRHFIKCH